jgi:hypothetical protein
MLATTAADGGIGMITCSMQNMRKWPGEMAAVCSWDVE